MDIPNLPFSSRFNFCLENKLIPFLNSVTIDDDKKTYNINNIRSYS